MIPNMLKLHSEIGASVRHTEQPQPIPRKRLQCIVAQTDEECTNVLELIG